MTIAMKRIWLENYRCFRARQEVRLAPLTLLVGENSTGKTSFLAMIRALWETAYRNRVPDFKDEPYDLGTFRDVAHFRGGKGEHATSFAAGFERKGTNKNKETSARCWAVTFSKRHTAPFPAKMRFGNKDESLWAEERYHSAPNVRLGRRNKIWELNADIESVDDDRYLPVHVFLSRDKRDRAQTQEIALPEEDDRAIGKLIGSALRAARASRPVYAGAPVRSKPPPYIRSNPHRSRRGRETTSRCFSPICTSTTRSAGRNYRRTSSASAKMQACSTSSSSNPSAKRAARFSCR